MMAQSGISWLMTLPFALQAIAIMVDEFYFHHRRGLPRWERWGHPLDTMTVAGVFVFLIAIPYQPGWPLMVAIGLAIFSCLFVTKDEFVHKEHCCWQENWLHAILFVTHSLVFTAAILFWSRTIEFPLGDPSWFLYGTLGVLVTFAVYQVIYWGFFAPQKELTDERD